MSSKYNTKKKRNYVDAADSNAGDDFHILWAVRKSLELLNFDDKGLQALTIEGLDNDENKAIDLDGDVLLGVDLAEYYGAEKFNDAEMLIVSQLKYSTRRADLQWTASRITTDSKGKKAGSIIGRLASFFSGLLKEYGKDDVAPKLILKLVSNRPASALLLSTIETAQKYINDNAKHLSLSSLKAKLSDIQRTEFETIANATGLKADNLLVFIKALSFSDCGTQSRLYQKQLIVKAICELGSSQSLIEYAQLKELVWGKMMPEQKQFNKITKEDVLYKFGISDVADLFPVPPKINTHNNTIQREQLKNISKSIVETDSPLYCIHAGAGMGKSTIANQIANELPQNSVSILFDCYANGAYDDPADKRHSHKYALLQICNELALQIGSSLLLETNGTPDYYIKEFRKRVVEAISIVRKINPIAIVSIIIDAADNSVGAAIKYQEKNFIHDLVQMNLPSGYKLIVTTRTARLSTLNLRDGYINIPLDEFSIPETKLFLKFYFDNVSETTVNEFHTYTKATPRVMAYSIELEGNTVEEKIMPLHPNGKSLEDIFRIRIMEARKRSGYSEPITSLLKYLACLPSPVPVNYLTDLAQLPSTLINDLSTDLWNGVKHENGCLSFKDEDFEVFIKNNYLIHENDFDIIAEYFYNKAQEDEYASIHLALFLSKSKQFSSSLVPLVLEQKLLLHPKDPIKNREVFIERIKLAMRVCKPQSIDFLKIQMVSADAAKTNKALEDILINRAELASAYGNILTNQKIYFQSGNPEWFGPAHYRSAAILSRKQETVDIAKKHLDQATKWVHYRGKLTEEEIHEFKIDNHDLANGAESVLRISGNLESCIDWIYSWRPKNMLYDLVKSLLKNTIVDNTLLEKIDFSPIPTLRGDIQLLIVKSFIEVNHELPFKIDRLLNSISVLRKLKLSNHLMLCIVSFAEHLCLKGYDNDIVISWLDLCKVSPPKNSPSFYTTYHEENDLLVDICFRKTALLSFLGNKQMVISDMYPQSLRDTLANNKEKNIYQDNDSKKEFDRVYRHLIPVYQNRLKGILKIIDIIELKKAIDKALEDLNNDYEISYQMVYRLSGFQQFMAVKILDVVFFGYENVINSIEKGYSSKKNNNIKLYISIAEKLSAKDFFYPKVLQLLDTIDKLIPNSSLPASEQIEYYAVITSIASRISSQDGKYYFDKMVVSSNEIDLEGHEQIKCINFLLGEKEFLRNPKLAALHARYIEYCWDRLRGWDHFPWEEGIEGLAKLDISSAFVVICQWDHRNVKEIWEHFIEILFLAVQSNYLSPDVAAGILPINQRYCADFTKTAELLLNQLDASGNHVLKNAIVTSLIQDLKINCSSERSFYILEKFLVLIKNSKFLNAETLDEYKDYCFKIQTLIKPKDENKESDTNSQKVKLEEKYEQLIRNTNIVDLKSLEQLVRQASALTSNNYVDEILLFKALHAKIPKLQCVSYLKEFIKLEPELISDHYYADILSDALVLWGSYPEVKVWKEEAFGVVLKLRFLSYYQYDQISLFGIKKLAKVFEVPNNKLALIIRNILPDYLTELSNTALYQLFHLSVLDLKSEEKASFIEWTLNLWNTKITDSSFDKILIAPYQETSAESTIANFVIYQLGHPDKRVRWKVVHSLTRLASLGNKSILLKLIEKQNENSCTPFQNADYPFYWISAKLFLWLAIEKICIKYPDLLAAHAQELYVELSNKELPHTLIRYFIRSSCLALSRHDKNLFTDSQSANLRNFFTLKVKNVKGNRSKRTQQDIRARSNTRFRFDSMDTLPYWYAPLGRIFSVSSDQVATIADKYINEYWGYSGEVWKDNHVKEQEYSLTSHSHGTEPTVELLQTYLEYHAMFCAATDLLEKKTINAKNHKNFTEWIEGWAKSWSSFWLSDFRDPIPLEKKYLNDARNTKEWEWNFSSQDFERAIGIIEPYLPGYLLLYARHTIHYGPDYESLSISSALVPPKTSLALLRTLQHANSHHYSLPFEQEEMDEGEMLDDDFEMTGWLKDVSDHHGGIDETDDLYNNISKSRIVLGTHFLKSEKLSYSEDFRYSFDKESSKVSILETWSNVPENIGRYSDVFVSSGNRLFVKTDNLLKYLKKVNKALILECQFYRHPKDKSYNDIPYYKKIFLIYHDGRIQTISRNYSIGQ